MNSLEVIKQLKSKLKDIRYIITGYPDKHNLINPNINISVDSKDFKKINLMFKKLERVEGENPVLFLEIGKIKVYFHETKNYDWVKFFKVGKKRDRNEMLNKYRELFFKSVVMSYPVEVLSYFNKYYIIDTFKRYDLDLFTGVYEVFYSYVKDDKLREEPYEKERRLYIDDYKLFISKFFGDFKEEELETVKDCFSILTSKKYKLKSRVFYTIFLFENLLAKNNLLNEDILNLVDKTKKSIISGEF